MPFFVGITGASGIKLGVRLVETLVPIDKVHLCVSSNARSVAAQETVELTFPQEVALWPPEAIHAPVGSGSYRLKGSVIIPCSMGTMGRIAMGISSNLIERAADVALKEGWPLILVPRETPFNTIHLENMAALSRAGGVILPPILTYYHRPHCIKDMEDFILGKILDRLRVEHTLFRRWKGDTSGQ